MTTEQARKILGKTGLTLSEPELEVIVNLLSALADVFIAQQMGVEIGKETDLH